MKTKIGVLLRLAALVGFSFVQSVSAASLTVITHGSYPDILIPQRIPDWVDDMAEAIALRIDPTGNGSNVTHYRLTKDQFLVAPTLIKIKGPEPGTSGHEMDIIIRVDWAALSGVLVPSTEGIVGNAVAESLVNPPTDGSYSRSFLELPTHFIGHSRGGFVNSMAIKSLGAKGIWVNNNTTLDAQSNPPGQEFQVWSNIRFAENYFQTCPLGNFSGFSLSGAFQRNLQDLVGFCGIAPTIVSHERVHTYYHGTIALNTNEVDDQTIVRDFWYGTTLGQQPKSGFYFSRFVPNEFLKTGFLTGLSQYFGGNGTRAIAPLNTSLPQWPNVVLQNLDNKWTFASGKEARLFYSYSDTDSAATITIGVDDDQNPYNNGTPSLVYVTTTGNPATKSGVIPESKSLPWFPLLEHNNRYLYAKITETSGLGRSRYYYLPQRITVTDIPPTNPLPPESGTDLVRSSTLRWDDRDGDEDSIPEGGERVRLQIRLQNNSTHPLENVRAILSSTLANVHIFQPEVLYGDFSVGQAIWSPSRFEMEFDFASSTIVPFKLQATYTKNGTDYYQVWTFSKTITQDGALEPRFVVDHVIWDDAVTKGDGDGILESGEEPGFRIALKNIGNATATEVHARVENVKILKVHEEETRPYPDLTAGGTAQLPSSGDFDLDGEVPKSFAGVARADIVVTYSGSDQEYVIRDYDLFDVKPAAWVKVSPETHDFGTSPTTQDISIAWTIRNAGSTNMSVTAITPSHPDTTLSGDELPWTLPPGDSKTVTVTIETSALQGQVNREVVLTTNARIDDANEDDRVKITGLVGDMVPSGSITNVTGANDPDISGNIIVWLDSRNGNSDVYGFNLATGIEFAICTNSALQRGPRISGNLVVWTDRRNWNGVGPENNDIYGFDLVTGQEIAISTNSADEWLFGVDGDLVAIHRDYEALVDADAVRTNYMNNLVVLERQANGSFSTHFTTGFTPGSGQEIRQTAVRATREAGFKEGFLVFKRSQYSWNTSTSRWEDSDRHIEAIDFATGQSLATRVLTGFPSRFGAAAHRFVYRDGDKSLRIWQNSTTQQLVVADLEPGDGALGFGGPDGSDALVYEYGQPERPGLYFLDRGGSNSENLILTGPVNVSNLRMDGLSVVWTDFDDTPSQVRYAFLKQPDVSIEPANIQFSNDSPQVGEAFDVAVTVRNLTKYSVINDLTVEIFHGDPDAAGVQLGASQTINGGLTAFGSAQVVFNSISVSGAGAEVIFVRVTPLDGENPANNKAFRTLTVLPLAQNVSLIVLDPHGFETDNKPAALLVQRSGSTNAPLTVNFTIGGTASNGVDYTTLSDSVTIPSGAFFTTVLVTPIDDALAESAETLILTLSSNAAYSIGSPGSATVFIADNDSAPQQPSFQTTTRLTDDSFEFNLLMDRGRTYVVDVSTNLSNWTPIFTNTSPDIVFTVIDLGSTNSPQRFYRIRNP